MKHIILLFALFLWCFSVNSQSFFQFHQLKWGWNINSSYSTSETAENLTCLFNERQLLNHRASMGFYDALGNIKSSKENFISGYNDLYAERYDYNEGGFIVYGRGVSTNGGFETKFTHFYDNSFRLMWQKGNDERINNHVFIDSLRVVLQSDSTDQNNLTYKSNLGLYSTKTGLPLWVKSNYSLINESIAYADSVTINDVVEIDDSIRIVLKNKFNSTFYFVELDTSGNTLRIRKEKFNVSDIQFLRYNFYSNEASGGYPKHRFKFSYFNFSTLKEVWTYVDSSGVLDASEITDVKEIFNDSLILLCNRRAYENVSGYDSIHSEVHYLSSKTGEKLKKLRYSVNNRSLSFTSLSVLKNSELYLTGNLFWFDSELSWGVLCKTNQSGFVKDSLLKVTEVMDTTSGVVAFRNNPEMNIYPNPNYGSFRVKCNELINQITIFDLFGKQVLLAKSINLNSVQIEHELRNGLYLMIAVMENGEILTSKIIVK